MQGGVQEVGGQKGVCSCLVWPLGWHGEMEVHCVSRVLILDREGVLLASCFCLQYELPFAGTLAQFDYNLVLAYKRLEGAARHWNELDPAAA